MKLFIAYITMMIVLVFIAKFQPVFSFPRKYVKVIWVADGDTIKIETGELVRYSGMNTPELHHPTKPVECFAQEAFEKNKELVEGKLVWLEKDKTDKDTYGRLLRYVYLKDQTESVNEYLLKEGFAKLLMVKPNLKFLKNFKEDQRLAKEKKLGLWSKCRKK